MYYILSNDISDVDEDAILEGEYVDKETEDFPFNVGIHIDQPGFDLPVQFEIQINSIRGKLTDNLVIDEIEGGVFSRKAIDCFLHKKIDNLQTFPLVLIDEFSNVNEVHIAKFQGEELDYKIKIYKDYFIINIIGLLDCVNHEASDLEYFTPRQDIPEDMPEDMKAILEEEEVDNDIDFIRKLVLEETEIPEDIQIFRLKDCPRILVFKEEMVQAIRAAQLTGFVFIPLSTYSDEIPEEPEETENREEQKVRKEEVAMPVESSAIVEKPRRKIVIKKK